ncbi:MAG: quinone-dependent dihydroorotate dehydrogenase [Candidatus Paceibacterota bacterium]|jgi:dihydroorotate dehydrogenase
MLYKFLLKPIFFKFDPELVHNRIISLGEFLGRFSLTKKITAKLFNYENSKLETEVCGIKFKNPVGLAAGFDKDVRLTQIIPEVSFGFMEVGAVTHLPCAGNPGRHLVRLPEDKSLIVYYGLKNIGSEAISKKLPGLEFKIPVGINIAKTNQADIKGDKSVEDYVQTYRLLASRFSYATINVSCPNAQDGCTFQDPVFLKKLMAALKNEPKSVPVFLKLSNHLSLKEVDDILEIVEESKLVDGFVLCNLSKDRASLKLKSQPEVLNILPAGGISGAPIRRKSNELIKYVYKKTNGRYKIIGVGGIFDAEDAYEKIKFGASLVQIITGLIYGGPATVKRINRGLVRLLEKDGYKNIEEAVGVEAY